MYINLRVLLFILFAIMLSVSQVCAQTQTCLITLTDASAITHSPDLENQACDIRNQVNSIFNLQIGQFKVFRAHLYLHIPALSPSHKEEQINIIKSMCNDSSDYYLAIIAISDSSVIDKHFRVIVRLPEGAQISCLNHSKINQIEEKIRQSIEQKYDDNIYPRFDPFSKGMSRFSSILDSLSQNSCCILSDYEILNMLKQTGFNGFPINLETPSTIEPQARFTSSNVHDFANLTFTLYGIEIDLETSGFQDLPVEVIITKNQNLCENGGASFQEAQNLFASSENVLWFHIWMSPDSMNPDLLFTIRKTFEENAETAPSSVVYVKRVEKTVVQFIPNDDLISSAVQNVEFYAPIFAFTSAASHLLARLADIIPNAYTEISNVEIINNGIGLFPAYNPYNGGGGMTIPNFYNKHQAVIRLTSNFFAVNGYGSHSYGNSPGSWLHLCAHEVVHIKHIRECNCSFSVYGPGFLAEYAQYGHDNSPREIEAEIGSIRYDEFNSWLITHKNTSISSIFSNSMTDIMRTVYIGQLWAEYPYK